MLNTVPPDSAYTGGSGSGTGSRSRLRGLSYSYLRTHLHRSDAPPPALPPALTRSSSSPGYTSIPSSAVPGTALVSATSTSNARGLASAIQISEPGRVSNTIPSTSNHTSAAASTTTEAAVPHTTIHSTADEMTRSRNVSTMPTPLQSTDQQVVEPLPAIASLPTASRDPQPSIRFIPHVEARSSRPSLQFTALSRTLKTPTSLVRVGRYSERDQNNTAAHGQDAASLPVGFKSKVVSRRHCEFWCTAGQWYIKDVKSSSGTFLNHVRLSAPGVESRPYPVNDGDVVQLGIDFKGGEEVIFRCVKIRVECNRGWQKSLNSFNTTAHKKLFKSAGLTKNAKAVRDSDAMSINSSSECSICLNPVAPCQALFVAPCSHVWHYKCVRNLIHGPNWPNFLCPNCRFVADLEADVEQPEEDDSWEVAAGEEDLLRAVEGSDGGSFIEAEAALSSPLVVTNGSAHDNNENGSDTPPRIRNTQRVSSDDDLTRLLRQTHLASTEQDAKTSPPLHTESTASRTRPIRIANRSQASSDDPVGARSTTPTSHTQFALSAGAHNPLVDGPMTPRNDAGPFVFDGSAGRLEQLDSSILGQPVAEVSEPATPEDGAR
ncbi:related to protein dma1 [Ramularia collo-cygni]|uniref:Related to protein dma1 n=1 Tax=Ramularia collo-cygni TaxID=112498 RepID=A0A2D3VBY5_9PEZI|nr:related to protein dma1 [Ramularia collo-cygni]CZT19119.1 related to protein dma1 [Ramularia collo-cygni]